MFYTFAFTIATIIATYNFTREYALFFVEGQKQKDILNFLDGTGDAIRTIA